MSPAVRTAGNGECSSQSSFASCSRDETTMITDQHENPQINSLFTSTAAKHAASLRKWGTWTAAWSDTDY
jgi:hypothetical protein